MSNIKIFNENPKERQIGFVRLVEDDGDPYLVLVNETGSILVYLARISNDGLHLFSCAGNDFIATTKDSEYVVIKKDE